VRFAVASLSGDEKVRGAGNDQIEAYNTPAREIVTRQLSGAKYLVTSDFRHKNGEINPAIPFLAGSLTLNIVGREKCDNRESDVWCFSGRLDI
jgi:hypothetical protein